jgi:outer membrane protein assembly factor BamB
MPFRPRIRLGVQCFTVSGSYRLVIQLFERFAVKRNSILAVILIILTSMSCVSGMRSKPFCLPYKHIITEDFSVQSIWSISDVYTFPNGFQPMMLGTPSRVFVATFNMRDGSPTFIALDSQTGEVLWNQKTDLNLSMLVTPSHLFLAEFEHIKVYNHENGNLMQEVFAPGVGTIQIRYIDNENLYAVTGHGRWLIYNLVSQQKDLSEPGQLYTPFMEDKGVFYRVDFEGFKAIEENTGRVIWVYSLFNEVIDAQPVFMDDLIILRTNARNIWVLNKSTGKLIWAYQSDIISNIAIDNANVLFLTENGQLVFLDKETGKENRILKFSETPFNLNFPLDSVVGGYYVWADLETNKVVVSLGDTCQILAFKYNDTTSRIDKDVD